tara:strand:+ start:5787 stop:6122 length:336 start_codon:yes stop_codon:yes gene_type:complete
MKEKQSLVKVLNKAALAGIIIVALSFIIPLVPCTKAPVTAEPVYKLGLCKLPNPFGEQQVGLSTKYYGSYTDSLAGAVLQFITPTIIVLFILMFFRKKASKMAKVLDLSKK